MGSQVNFYLSNVDHHNLVRELSKIDGICYVMPPLTTADFEPRELNSLQQWKPGEHQPYLFLRKQKPILRLGHRGPNQLAFYVDESGSSVVEYSHAKQSENEIQRGRLYYTSRYTGESGFIHEKPSEFIEFAKAVFKIAKKFCKARHEGFYVGPDAAVLRSKGFKLPLN